MSKSRPEKIELTLPVGHATEAEISAMLQEELHTRAKLKRQEVNGRVILSFWPTRSEYFIIQIKFCCICERSGGKLKSD